MKYITSSSVSCLCLGTIPPTWVSFKPMLRFCEPTVFSETKIQLVRPPLSSPLIFATSTHFNPDIFSSGKTITLKHICSDWLCPNAFQFFLGNVEHGIVRRQRF